MRIVFLQDDFPPASFGGAGFSTYELAMGMKEAGHEVFVITACREKADAGEIFFNGLKIFRIFSNYSSRWRAYLSVNNFSAVRQVEEILKGLKIDVVHANNIHYHLSFAALKVAKKYARTVVFTARDVMTVCCGKLATDRYLKNFDVRIGFFDDWRRVGLRWNPFRNFLIKRYLKYADKITAVSNELRDTLLANGIKGVTTVHTGMDDSVWRIDESAISVFKEKYDLVGKKVIFFGGRLSADKGGEKSIEAMKLVVEKIPEVVLLVAGKIDWYAEEMKKMAKSLGILEKIIFTGWISGEDLKCAYGSSDFVLVPSAYLDPFPRVVLEAMALKKPVVATCYGGAKEIVADGETGYIINPLYPEEIAEKVINLLKDNSRLNIFGEAGYQRLNKDLNFNDYVSKYLKLYKKLSGEISK